MMDLVRSIAEDTSKVHLSDHAVGRMYDRGISDADVFRTLRNGDIRGKAWVEESGEQACKVVLTQRGDRAIGVVTIVFAEDGELLVKTVEWEDWK